MSWLQLAVGVLILISPWVLGMQGTVIVWTNAALGSLLVLMSVWGIFVKDSIKK
jgi:SPW repeat